MENKRSMENQYKHNYWKKVLKVLGDNELTKGSLHRIRIEHDDWCASPDGYCNCNPDVKLLGEDEAYAQIPKITH